jgi:hypothetical protein
MSSTTVRLKILQLTLHVPRGKAGDGWRFQLALSFSIHAMTRRAKVLEDDLGRALRGNRVSGRGIRFLVCNKIPRHRESGDQQ